jgi:hypothetical protein
MRHHPCSTATSTNSFTFQKLLLSTALAGVVAKQPQGSLGQTPRATPHWHSAARVRLAAGTRQHARAIGPTIWRQPSSRGRECGFTAQPSPQDTQRQQQSCSAHGEQILRNTILRNTRCCLITTPHDCCLFRCSSSFTLRILPTLLPRVQVSVEKHTALELEVQQLRAQLAEHKSEAEQVRSVTSGC